MKIKKCSKEDIFKYIDLQENDVILYLGGRIDDDNLYPPKYIKYLKAKIKRLKPTKIICHNHWYAKKYYESGILTKHTKIDMVLTYYHYFKGGELQTINPTDYDGHHNWIKMLIDKNPNIVYAMYISEGNKPPLVKADDGWFREDYDLNNVKYFSFDRTYSPQGLTGEDLGHGVRTRNASDGFGVVTNLVKAGFKNINILGFSAFGSDEDMSYHTTYNCGGDSRFVGRKYFDLEDSVDQRAEADILQYWAHTKKIKNLESYEKLIYTLKDK